MLREHDFHGFPVVRGEQLLGYITRNKLRATIGALIVSITTRLTQLYPIDPLLAENMSAERSKNCIFAPSQLPPTETIDLSRELDDAVLKLRKEVPLELVVRMFQRMVSVVCSLQKRR